MMVAHYIKVIIKVIINLIIYRYMVAYTRWTITSWHNISHHKPPHMWWWHNISHHRTSTNIFRWLPPIPIQLYFPWESFWYFYHGHSVKAEQEAHWPCGAFFTLKFDKYKYQIMKIGVSWVGPSTKEQRKTTDRVAGAALSDRSPWAAPVYFIRIIIIIIIIIITLTILVYDWEYWTLSPQEFWWHFCSRSPSSSMAAHLDPPDIWSFLSMDCTYHHYQHITPRKSHIMNLFDHSHSIFLRKLSKKLTIWTDLTFDHFYFKPIFGLYISQ